MRVGDHAEVTPIPVEQLGQRYRRYRLADPAAEEAMARSLSHYGQLAPATACWRGGRPELLDGFKRLSAAAGASWPSLSVRVLDIDERSAKPAILYISSVLSSLMMSITSSTVIMPSKRPASSTIGSASSS